LNDFTAKKAAPAATEATTPAASDDRPKAMTIRLNTAAWRQLKWMAIEQGRTAHAVLIDAINDYFEKDGKARLA